VRKGASETVTAGVFDQLRHEILAGDLRPGERLKPAELGERLGASVTVVREALTRLTTLNLVRARHNQGFVVAPLVRKELEDLTSVRKLVEPHSVSLAVERGDLQWESEVLAAHHRMAHTKPAPAGQRNQTTEEFIHHHRKFHETLIAACDVPLLTEMCRTLWDSAALYRRWSAASPAARRRDSSTEHREIMEACLDRKPDLAADLLRGHIQATTDILLESQWTYPIQMPSALPE
jgi:DNA-binding GntR family transcriptional regulator